MIKTKDAMAAARALIGTPYGEMDCIALIRGIIKKSPGGVRDYRCEGTNWLWRSIANSGKYRHLTWRQESTEGARAGMLAFKRDGDNIHHVGIVTECGTVIHSSSTMGCVVETIFDETWHLLASHRHIEVAADEVDQPEVSAEPEIVGGNTTTMVNEETGDVFTLLGRWRIAED